MCTHSQALEEDGLLEYPELLEFRRASARLRAACFAVMLQQVATEREEEERDASRKRLERKRSKRELQLKRHDSMRAGMIGDQLLATAFAAFDREGKGYITEDDLQRVLAGFGRRVDSDSALRGYLAAAAGYDREQRRATYGNFIRVMAHTVKQTSERGETLFKQGDPVRYFYCLLSGELEVVKVLPNGKEAVLNTLRAGEFFGERPRVTLTLTLTLSSLASGPESHGPERTSWRGPPPLPACSPESRQ